VPDLKLVLLAANLAFAALAVAVCCWRRYDFAVVLLGLSPLVGSAFIPNVEQNLEQIETDSGIGSYLRISLLMLIGAVGVLKFLQSKTRWKLPPHLILLGIFVTFALLSTSYSLDPQFTFIRAATGTAVFGCLLGLHAWLDRAERVDVVMKALLVMVFIGTAANAASAFVLPQKAWDVLYRLQGLSSHPNMLGEAFMLAYPILLWNYSRSDGLKRWFVLILTASVFFLHVLTGSRGSLVPSALLICIWFLVLRQWGRLICFTVSILIGGVLILQLMPEKFERPDNTDFSGLTDRPEFWAGALQLILERPLQGYGYGVEGKVWEDPRFQKAEYYLWAGSAKTSLHNGFLSVGIGGGLLVLALWCTLLLGPLIRCFRLPADEYKAFGMCVIVSCLIHNFVETDISIGGSTDTVFWIAWLIMGHDVLREATRRVTTHPITLAWAGVSEGSLQQQNLGRL